MKSYAEERGYPGLTRPPDGGNSMDIIDILALAQLQELIYNASKDADNKSRKEIEQ